MASYGGIKTYTHTHTSESTTWTVYHFFGSKPIVETIINNNGILTKAIPASVEHVDNDTLIISWTSPRTGFAMLASE